MSSRIVNTLEVRRANWSDTRIKTEALDSHLNENELLFEVGRLALTANNISYASSGDSLSYREFFPAGESWGRIPATGWASPHSLAVSRPI